MCCAFSKFNFIGCWFSVVCYTFHFYTFFKIIAIDFYLFPVLLRFVACIRLYFLNLRYCLLTSLCKYSSLLACQRFVLCLFQTNRVSALFLYLPLVHFVRLKNSMFKYFLLSEKEIKNALFLILPAAV